MENRGQKRADTVDELPADKRACSSFDFRTNNSNTSSPAGLKSSESITETQNSYFQTQMNHAYPTPETQNSSVETQVNSTHSTLDETQNSSIQILVNAVPNETQNSSIQTQVNSLNSTLDNTHTGDIDTSSSVSASSRSEGENEKDSAYGSCDSDEEENLGEYQERQSSGVQGQFKNILSSLSEESEPSQHLAGLTQLCEVLSFCTDSSLSSTTADSLSLILVKFAQHECNPDIMLLSIRAITYLCDVSPRSSNFLVRHDVVPALCQRLMAIEYLDVAEQCLQAMEKISRDQPLKCLQAGAVMAVLNYIDFFSTSLQRVALSTVVNICKKLPSECPSSVMDAVPILCNLLQYEDRQLVEHVANSFIKIVERISPSSEMLDEICKHGVISQVTHLINLNSRTTLSKPIHNGLIGLLAKLAAGSVLSFSTLYELDISSILKDIISTHELSRGMSSPHVVDGHCSQVYEVLKLLNELLPNSTRDLNVQPMMDKGSFLFNHPDLLRRFGMDILPTLIQVVNSGANLYVCYGCLSVVNKLVNLSQPDMLHELLKNSNISSFLAGVFTRKDHHVLMLALQIAEIILQKLFNCYLTSFIKEGVLFAIDALLTPEKCSRLMFPMFSELSVDSSQKSAGKEVPRCLCYAFSTAQSSKASEVGPCKLEKDSIHNLANQIRTSYFREDLYDSEKGMTDILQKLRGYSSSLYDLMNSYNDDSAHHDEKYNCILHQIVANLCGKEPISTFEFIESGIVKSLVSYLSSGQYARDKVELHSACGISYMVEKRSEMLGRVFFSSSNAHFKDFPLLVLIQKLQSALSSLENFPVILSPVPKRRHSFATVPNGRSMMHPCLRVCFVRGEGEAYLHEHSGDVLTVDPFSSFDAIEEFMRPRVCSKRSENTSSATEGRDRTVSPPIQLETDSISNQDEIPDPMDSDMPAALTELEIDRANLSPPEPGRQIDSAEMSSMDGNYVDPAMEEPYLPSEADTDRKVENHASSSSDEPSSKLLFYLEGQLLDRTLTFYQAILQQQIKAENEMVVDPKFWSQTYTVTYRSFIKPKHPEGLHSVQELSVLDKVRLYVHHTSWFSSIFTQQLASDLDRSNPIYDILLLLKSLERMNRLTFHLMARERVFAFAEGSIDNLDNLKTTVPSVLQKEFVSCKLTEKLEQQMRDSLAVSTGGLPPWCVQLMVSCPFLFSFEARSKYFRLKAFGTPQVQLRSSSHSNYGSPSDRRSNTSGLPRKKFLACRDQILESAAQMMDLYAREKVVIEVEYTEEVGTGLGPTLEFYTLVSLEFQKTGLCMWRGDDSNDSGFLASPYGLFPRPWSSALERSNGVQLPEVIKKFGLLGQVVAKALQDGRVMDFPFSKAFYKLILGQELSLYDIQSFDPELGRTLLEFHAIVARNKYLDFVGAECVGLKANSCFHDAKIEDLCLDFTLPGYPDYHLTFGPDHSLVNMANLEDYVTLVVNATIRDGISRQLEAFKSGFNQVFPIEHLHMFVEEEIECLLCGEHETWAFNELMDHIKFDHGYTASSPPITNLLEIILEFNSEERRAFIQFVTGAPRLPPGGLASLNPKLTIVRKHCSKRADEDLPSVMTCANYLKLPPYSSKERMKEKLLYAITEGQGSFHLS